MNKRPVWIIFAVKWLLMFTCMITNSHAQPLPSRRGCCNILTSFYSLHYKCVKIHWIPQTFCFIVYWLFDDHKHDMIAHCTEKGSEHVKVPLIRSKRNIYAADSSCVSFTSRLCLWYDLSGQIHRERSKHSHSMKLEVWNLFLCFSKK